ncbi:hypothetical protein J437_LFUL016502 [Ladona fulva]|uniref:Reverse transcriptase n=1 Tax=Ladona fulva TaxID=123851 RepID=A0A8K0KPQ5_LADFU|nr:hypothetical protein J437_LFUL016502 [Ladona fulva]
MRLAAAYLQRATCQHLEWYSKWRLGVNAKKTQTILFTMKTTADDPDPIIVDTEEVPWSNTAIYLGVTLDRRLSLKQHAKANASKARTRGRLIHPLLRSPLLKLRTKTQLYQMTILSMLLYASPAWSGFLTRNSWDILGKTERTILRTILALGWTFRNETTYLLSGINPIDKTAILRAKKFFAKLPSLQHEHLRSLAEDTPQPKMTNCIPRRGSFITTTRKKEVEVSNQTE